MIIFNQVPASGDPWENQQVFERLNINVLCCRYCWLTQWNSEGMAFPYWRLYWNKTEGAYVIYKHKVYLSPGVVLLIPPYTPFSSGIEGNLPSSGGYHLKGGWIHDSQEEEKFMALDNVLHLYIHFNLGMGYDNIVPGIYQFPLDNTVSQLIDNLLNKVKHGSDEFNLFSSLTVYHLIVSLVNKLPENVWKRRKIDARIRKVIQLIEQNLSGDIENKTLADHIHMAPNSFLRLFRENMEITPHQYISRLRIDKACDLLHHSTASIDRIADECGFFDRYHFSRAFTRVMKVSPVYYRKSMVLEV